MDKREYVNIADIELSGKLLDRITMRPIGQIVALTAIGAALIMLKTKVAVIAGILFLALAAASLIIIKDRPVLDFYDDCIVVYNNTDSTKAIRISMDELKMWTVDASDNKAVFTLTDGEVLTVHTARYLKVYAILTKLVGEKCEPSTIDKIRNRMKKGN